MDNNLFNNIEKESKVNKEDIFKLASSVQNSNLRDEKVLRQLIHQVAIMAGREVSKEKEDQIINAIINNNMPADFSSLSKMFKK
ncbi:Stage VI sporulation protein F [Bacillus sp. 491mf]|uniref:stage VI sporulation protein F n=1 Tax=Bacillus TaxID=1386 RepID=UPI00054F6F86|nr:MULTISPECIES: stage VI sporulation protein F [unclassified Bacillus (in: firmicutes)]SFC16935.1 Stage VI sporulation protein F [Bacillus sp. 491mf]